MQIGVLGPLEVLRDGAETDLGPRKQRALLAALTLHAGEVVSLDRLGDLVWGDAPPAAAAASLHGYVAALRRLLEPDRAARGAASVLLTVPPGYRLQLPAGALDADRFAALVETVHRQAPGDVLPEPDPSGAAELEDLLGQLETALALWRGDPYPELDGRPEVEAECARLRELHRRAVHDRARVLLALDRPAVAAQGLARLVHEERLADDSTTLLALALARCGRQTDALDAIRVHREALADELGLDPGPVLQHLETAILRQDPGVLPTPVPVDRDPGPDEPYGHPPGPPLVGRSRELAALEDLLTRATTGVPQLAALVGEPGIGKSRLATELSAVARDRGFLVLTGRCSSDEGAPPLWPWVAVLRALAAARPGGPGPAPDELLAPPTDGLADRFRLFDRTVDALVLASRQQPVLLVLDDLHWADASTLRLLQHLVEDLDRGRVVVLVTRRAFPAPTGALADLAGSLARRQVLRLELHGLDAEEVQALADATGRTRVDPDQARRLRARTGGNPFYVVELLRWREDLPVADTRRGVPPAVGDVITARLAALPGTTQQLLRTAAALARHLDLGLLASLDGTSLEEVLDALDPAVASGFVVVDEQDGSVRFSHALVKDAVEATDPPLRRQLRHARLARHLQGRATPDRLAELAHHWLRAGPAHAGDAWRAAARAAAHAATVGAHEEAAALLGEALASQLADPTSGWPERYDLLMARSRACRAAADSGGQRVAAAEATRLADDADDGERLARAAVASSEGALWSNRPEGDVDRPTIDALHRASGLLPAGDSELRGSVFLALSRELFWAPGHQEAAAYAEQGLALARRLGAARLQAQACHALVVSTLEPATLEQRRALAAESVACARTAEDPELEAVGLFWVAVMAGEGGRIPERAAAVQECRAIAERYRLRYLQVMLGCYDIGWLALQGRGAEGDAQLADVQRWAVHADFPFRDEAVAAAQAWLALWRGRADDLLEPLLALDATSPTDVGTTVLLLMLRSGRLQQAAAYLDERPVPLVDDDFAVTFDLAVGAEAALLLGRPGLGADVYALMAGWSGRAASAGTGAPLGPVDAFLALAAAAVGEDALATSHADDALRLCDAWDLLPVAEWLTGLRERFGF